MSKSLLPVAQCTRHGHRFILLELCYRCIPIIYSNNIISLILDTTFDLENVNFADAVRLELSKVRYFLPFPGKKKAQPRSYVSLSEITPQSFCECPGVMWVTWPSSLHHHYRLVCLCFSADDLKDKFVFFVRFCQRNTTREKPKTPLIFILFCFHNQLSFTAVQRNLKKSSLAFLRQL